MDDIDPRAASLTRPSPLPPEDLPKQFLPSWLYSDPAVAEQEHHAYAQIGRAHV